MFSGSPRCLICLSKESTHPFCVLCLHFLKYICCQEQLALSMSVCHCLSCEQIYLVNEFILYIFQAGILVVGRGNQVVELVIGSDVKMLVVFVVFWSY